MTSQRIALFDMIGQFEESEKEFKKKAKSLKVLKLKLQ
jgi:hypothetical protein